MFKKLLIFIVFTITLMAQNPKGHLGKEFVFSFIPNWPLYDSALSLYITAKEDTQGVVEIPDIVYSQAFEVKKGEVTKVSLPSAFMRDMHWAVMTLDGCHFYEEYDRILKKALFIYSQKDILVYAFSRQLYTTDASLLIPTKSLGYEYIAVGYESPATCGVRSVVSISALYDHTKVVIIPNDTSYRHANHIPIEIMLDRGETYFLGAKDVTGTHIRSTYPISVSSGHNRAFVPTGFNASRDILIENIPPIVTWGKEHITVPFAQKSSDLFRIVSSQDGTVVTFNGVEEVRLAKGEVYETITHDMLHIETSHPCMVAQYMLTSNWDNVQGTDPMLVILPAVEQYKKEYVFTSLTKSENAQDNYVNVMIPTAAIPSLRLDGNDTNASLFQQVADTSYSAAEIKISAGSHTIQADQPFGIVVYGMGTYESYGYTGGSDFKFINNQTDKYAPNIHLEGEVKRIRGVANDDEDIDQNGVLGPGEDLNMNHEIDRRTEDINGNNILDTGEDGDGDGLIDIDGGIYSITLDENASNVRLSVEEYIPGSTRVEFSITLIDQNSPGTGSVIVSDGAGNIVKKSFEIPVLYHDVEVVSTLLTEGIVLDTGSFTVPPDSIVTDTQETRITWKFADFNMTQIEDLDYEVEVTDIYPGSTKTITQKLEVNYRDLRGKDINITLGEQHIKVLAPLANAMIDTDKDTYTADQNVHMDINVSNTNSVAYSLRAKISILDDTDTQVSVVDEVEITQLQSGDDVFFGADWNSTDVLAGRYHAVVELYDTNGHVVDMDEASFTIISAYSPDQAVLLDSSIFGYEFRTTDTVAITNVIRDRTRNTIYRDVTLQATMTRPDGSSEQVHSEVISTLLPQSTLQRQITLPFHDATPGVYRVEISLLDSQGALLSMDTVHFKLLFHADEMLLGDTKTRYNVIDGAQVQQCTDTIRNFATVPMASQQIRQRLLNLTNGFVISEAVSSHDLEAAAANAVVLTRTYDRPLKVGSYSCLLEAKLGDAWVRLDNAVFEVKPSTQGRATILAYTDKSVYGTEENLTLTQKTESYSAVEGNYTSSIEIHNAANTLVKRIVIDPLRLSAHSIDTHLFTLEGAALGAGEYQVTASLYRSGGAQVSQSSTHFTITADAPVASITVSVAKPIHYNSDLANLFAVATNHSATQLLDAATVALQVIDTQGLVIHEHNRTLGDMGSLEAREINDQYLFSNLDVGIYRVVARLYSQSTVVATAQTTFEVQKISSNALSGRVSLERFVITPGEEAICRYRVTNSSDDIYSNQEIKTVVLDAHEQIVQERTEYHTIQPRETLELERHIQTDGLAEGSYRCQLEVSLEDRWYTLDKQSFTLYSYVPVAPTQIAEDNRSKMLVLLDDELCTAEDNSTHVCSQPDPYGPTDAPDLATQRRYLEQLLDAEGYHYDIVTDSQSFMMALRTGAYGSYFIQSEALDLSKEAQKELREAIYKGENIFFGGTHYRKNIYLLIALGIDIKGECREATGYEIAGSSHLSDRRDDFVLSEKVLQVVDRGASAIGRYVECDCSSYATAVTEHTYGVGHAIFVGFDLLSQATKAGAQSSYHALLLEILQHIVPIKQSYDAGTTVALKIPFSVEDGVSRAVMTLETDQGRLGYDSSVIQKRAQEIAVPFTLSGERVSYFSLRLPQQRTAVEVTASLLPLGSTTQSVEDQMHKRIEVQRHYSYDDLLAQLAVTQITATEQIRAEIVSARDAETEDARIEALIEASNLLEALHSSVPDVVRLRVMLAHLLRYTQIRQVGFAEHMRERLDVLDSRMTEDLNSSFEFMQHLDPAFRYLKKDD